MCSTAAQVIIHTLDDFRLRRLGFFQKQTIGVQDHPRGTETALESVLFDEGFLERVEAPILS
jgi:hypothetical protein